MTTEKQLGEIETQARRQGSLSRMLQNLSPYWGLFAVSGEEPEGVDPQLWDGPQRIGCWILLRMLKAIEGKRPEETAKVLDLMAAEVQRKWAREIADHARVAAVLEGRALAADRVPPGELEHLAGRSDVRLVRSPSLRVLFLGLRGPRGAPVNIEALLFGSLLAVSPEALGVILLVSLLVLVLMLRVGPQLAYATFDPELARLSGVRVAALESLLLAVTALVVVVGVKTVGVVLVSGFVVIPAEAAQSWVARSARPWGFRSPRASPGPRLVSSPPIT